MSTFPRSLAHLIPSPCIHSTTFGYLPLHSWSRGASLLSENVGKSRVSCPNVLCTMKNSTRVRILFHHCLSEMCIDHVDISRPRTTNGMQLSGRYLSCCKMAFSSTESVSPMCITVHYHCEDMNIYYYHAALGNDEIPEHNDIYTEKNQDQTLQFGGFLRFRD